MKKILVFLDNFDTGGVTSVVRTIYENLDNADFSMDFVRRNVNINEFDREILSNGNRILYYQDCGLNRIPVWNYKHRQLFIAKQVITQIKQTKIRYDVIHIHANPIIGLYIGMKLQIPIRIMHAHEAIPDFGDNIYQSKIIAAIWKNRVKRYNQWSTIKAGDSKKACIVKFGEQIVNDPSMRILYPPLDMQRFDPEQYDNTEIEKQYHPDRQVFNMIHVGRLNPVKNQKFLIDILACMIKQKPAHLYIVGEGDQKDTLLTYAQQKGVADKLTLLRSDTTPGLYKFMNCSLLPSFSEAFGMVAVESQLMGVPCFASKNVPDDVDIGMCTFLHLNEGAENWVNAILSYKYDGCSVKESKKKQFQVKELISGLEKLYKEGN